MITKKQIQFIQSLQRKKERKSALKFVVEGKKMIEELIENNGLFRYNIYTTDEDFAEKHDAIPVNKVQMEQMSGQKSPSGYLAVVDTVMDQKLPVEGKVLVLDEIKDPGNLGTILRIADWFGIGAIILSENTVDEYNPKVVQASMGSIFRVTICRTDLLSFFKVWNHDVMGMVLEGAPLQQQQISNNMAVVIGSESHGIRSSVLPYLTQKARIEGVGDAESLNAAIATAIITYVVSRQ